MHEQNGSSIHVLVVDDSAVVRQVMSTILSQEEDMSVEVAADGFIAMQKIARRCPDVVLLDLEMPRMDGLTFLRKLMADNPLPVVVCSGAAGRGTATALRALEEGAVEVLSKPELGVRQFLCEAALSFVDVVRAAAEAKVLPKRSKLHTVPPRLTADAILPRSSAKRPLTLPKASIIVIGASTGGTEALRDLLMEMPQDCPGIVIVQHMPEGFTGAFAKRLNELCQITVKEAQDGDCVTPGSAFIAPGNRHVLLRSNQDSYRIELNDGPLVSRHRPSVDVLFRSAARSAGKNAVGVILTGMGEDGAEGMLELKQAGAFTIAQDEATSVVFGMPKEAIERGAIDQVLALDKIASTCISTANSRRQAGTAILAEAT